MNSVDKVKKGWKLFRLRKDGTLGSLFINRKARIPVGKWLKAESHPTKGYKHRPWWHALSSRNAPHLTKKDRRWHEVELRQVREMPRPRKQGSSWYLAEWMKIME